MEEQSSGKHKAAIVNSQCCQSFRRTTKSTCVTTQRISINRFLSATGMFKLNEKKVPLNVARASRKLLFEPLPRLSTRLIAALAASGAAKKTVENAETIHRKIQGTRAGTLKPAVEGIETPETISVSQRSFDRQADFFKQLILLLENEAAFSPSEADLKITSLNALQQQLVDANIAVLNAYVPYNNALVVRNHTLYDADSGMIDVAYVVKSYVRSLFGARSAEYAQVSGIK